MTGGLVDAPRPSAVRRRASRGSSLVEMAITVPVLASVMMGVAQMSFACYAYGAITNGVREAARYATVHPTDTSGITSAARTRVVLANASTMTVTVTYPDGTSTADSRVQVTASYSVPIFVPGFPAITLSSSSTMRVEP